MWFLEEEFSVEMDDDGVSVEYQSAYSDPPPFDIEYEVQSEADDDDVQEGDGMGGNADRGNRDDENRSESSEEVIRAHLNLTMKVTHKVRIIEEIGGNR